MAKLVRIYTDNPNEKEILKIVEVLKNGGVIIYPSDTVYALGCDITNYKAMERVAKIKNIKLEKNSFSIVCNDLSHLSDYTKPIDTSTFKILKRAFPGPYTFVLPAINNMPKAFKKRKTVGIRVPDNSITRRIIELLGNPLVSSSIYDEDEVIEYTTDPELIHEKWDDLVDVVIDGGYGDNVASTVIDLSEGEPVVLREGKGSLDIL
ncbi:translation factor Sua5 [Wenyingzhuangia fucanilytica]|uniref:Translation factor Sua5 n=1 Tax=Wenyingzhuangia fucanilytica TaxID=1790137 RepID=A0A1B1Y424_9FLAO|nr:L-threonylcarbamoyladenylate synthase [Wenyingzhuangia fucanilytica]ANW95525.1 translation factor Sua5 [Wenyingzhuangia fucanilytica]